MIIVTPDLPGIQVVRSFRDCQEKQIPFVAMVRSPERQSQLTAQGIPNIPADFEQPDSLRMAIAMTGADRAFSSVRQMQGSPAARKTSSLQPRESGIRHIVKAGAYAAAHDAEVPIFACTCRRGRHAAGIRHSVSRLCARMVLCRRFSGCRLRLSCSTESWLSRGRRTDSPD